MVKINLPEITQRVKEILEVMNLRLYDIQFNEVSRILRIFIDKEGTGVTIKDCELASNTISEELDRIDIINFPYTLEVSSPGIERHLSRPEHYQWALGKLVEITLKEEKIKGHIQGVTETGVIITRENQETAIPFDKILKAKLLEEF